MLNDIFSLLEPLSTAPGEDLRSLAREARMVMTARLASAFDVAGKKSSTSSSGASETSQETYQKALKLLQDPLLPVRAHGLMLLRQLVSARGFDLFGIGVLSLSLDARRLRSVSVYADTCWHLFR